MQPRGQRVAGHVLEHQPPLVGGAHHHAHEGHHVGVAHVGEDLQLTQKVAALSDLCYGDLLDGHDGAVPRGLVSDAEGAATKDFVEVDLGGVERAARALRTFIHSFNHSLPHRGGKGFPFTLTYNGSPLSRELRSQKTVKPQKSPGNVRGKLVVATNRQLLETATRALHTVRRAFRDSAVHAHINTVQIPSLKGWRGRTKLPLLSSGDFEISDRLCHAVCVACYATTSFPLLPRYAL